MYKLLLNPSAKKDLDSLPDKILKQLKDKILGLKEDPRPMGSIKLTGEEGYRIRSGKYRILYRIEEERKEIYIYRVKHRREAYQ